ncbi:hypothetical protein NQ318_000933 [Aromia moschata]|uniref:Uncharacterized protein n=1 Tax=Aromia moschata TaxID=1265417 RepID=A0AAV8ZGP9_9CUCU|nr:hypothetical protein NQ318_000933 [Aromia moschata]
MSGDTFPTLSSLDKPVKSALKGTRFESVEAVKAKATGSEPADRSGLPALLSTMEKSYGAM